MRAYIAHGEADQAIADDLKEYLKPLGLFAETESGARGFRHLQGSDVVIALWSKNALFTPYRMMLEKRMLDAWADGQLVLVKLDHHFLPVGMRDLPATDATFESARKITAWRDIARQAKDTINRLLVERQQQSSPGSGGALQSPAASAPEPSMNDRAGRAGSYGARAPMEPPATHGAKHSSSWFLKISTVVLLLALLGVGGNVLLGRFNESHETEPETAVETPVEVAGPDQRVSADFLAMLESADLANGAAEAAKCQMCHSFEPGGPVLLGPPLYDIIGADIASHDGFAYSSGGAGLADVEGPWTYRNLNEFLERPKAIAEGTTMFFAGLPREQTRADLIAYLRTLTPGDPRPLPEALPPGVTSDAAEQTDLSQQTPQATEAAEPTAIDEPMRQLRDISDRVLQQPLLIAGAALILLAFMLLVAKAASRKPQMGRVYGELPDDERLRAGAASKAKLARRESDEQSDAPASEDLLFISYAHGDNEQVQPVVKLVQSNGREVWIDTGGIQAGEGWAGEIVRAIKAAGGVMVMCSARAFESDHIKREIYLADRYKKPMLPIFLEDAQPPEDFEYFFAGVQWLELFKLPEADRASAIGRALASV